MSGPLYGVMAELADADALLAAVARARAAGFVQIEAYSPMPVEGLADALGFTRNRVPLWTLLGGIAGGAGGYFMQWYSTVVSLPLNTGGRPLHSWPLYVPVTFELTILGAALAAFAAMLACNGLPKLHHPVFNAPAFDQVTRDRFFICLRDQDGERTKAFLQTLEPLRVMEVPE
ncbi:MAG: DUF3341 domain-containing protein [Gammaproteobacteria bacterium]